MAAGFLEMLLPELREKKYLVFILKLTERCLQKLTKIMKFCNIVSMDFKFASECERGFFERT
jgi:hypothetical protein